MAQERKGRLECRRGKHGRNMYEAAGLDDERLSFSNQATSGVRHVENAAETQPA
jgi:hypothetical protein